jgi:hypothetical protein
MFSNTLVPKEYLMLIPNQALLGGILAVQYLIRVRKFFDHALCKVNLLYSENSGGISNSLKKKMISDCGYRCLVFF